MDIIDFRKCVRYGNIFITIIFNGHVNDQKCTIIIFTVYHFNIFVAFYIVHIINRYIKARILIILYIDGFTDVIHTDLIPTFRLWSCKKNLWDICIIVPYKRTFVFVTWIG